MSRWPSPLDGMAVDAHFWSKQNVFITGHTGFKGAWLSLLLKQFGTSISGYSLAESPTAPCLYDAANLSRLFDFDVRGDIADLDQVKSSLLKAQPTILVHMAAQSLVLESYESPIETYMTNVMGTAHVLEAARMVPSIKAIVIVTTDKCYRNVQTQSGYKEDSPLGGYDPYSNSKACAELVSDGYRSSFFANDDSAQIATARAGNVIGGGDWADNRLLPDCYRAFSSEKVLELRNPEAIRPWQHVLEPLVGYMALAEHLVNHKAGAASAWNFGPSKQDELEAHQVANIAQQVWGSGELVNRPDSASPVETKILRLDSSKAISELSWKPKWSAQQAVEHAMSWYYAVHNGADPSATSEEQINDYLA